MKIPLAFLFPLSTAVWTLAGCAGSDTVEEAAPGAPISWTLRWREVEAPGAPAVAKTRQEEWDPRRTMLVVCDMWDDHWCRGAAERVVEMAPSLDRVVRAARERGVLILHAPSTCVDFYDGHPARERAKAAPHSEPPVPLSTSERWGTAWCWPTDPEGELPIDDSNMGCDCATRCEIREAWTRQIESIHIDDSRDVISDNGQEVWNLMAEQGIDNVILTGVHLNMCVLGRPFGIRQMTRLGKNVILLRDLTDTMYDSRSRPFVNHFRGTDLVVEHVETHWCPSATSDALVGGEPFRFVADPAR